MTQFLQDLIQQDTHSQYLIVDTNHSWSSSAMTTTTWIIQPDSLSDLIGAISQLDQFKTPRLKGIIVESLPLYFRDFRNGDVYGKQNLRAYSFCLSLLKRLCSSIPCVVSSFPNGMYPQQPLMVDISRYYCDEIYHLVLDTSYTLTEV